MTLRPHDLDRSLVGGPLDFDPIVFVPCNSYPCAIAHEHAGVAMAHLSCGHTYIGCAEALGWWEHWLSRYGAPWMGCNQCVPLQGVRLTKVEAIL